VADPDRPLEATRWQVAGTFDQQAASSLAAPQGELVLSGGQVRFAGPCHSVEGPAAITGTTITFGSLTIGSPRPCTSDQQRSETSVTQRLAGDVRATVTDRALRLENRAGAGIDLVAAV